MDFLSIKTLEGKKPSQKTGDFSHCDIRAGVWRWGWGWVEVVVVMMGVKHGKWRQREKLLHKDTKAGRNTAELQKREG